MAPQVGFEPTTRRLTADCSTTELLRNVLTVYIKLVSLDIISFLKLVFNVVFNKIFRFSTTFKIVEIKNK